MMMMPPPAPMAAQAKMTSLAVAPSAAEAARKPEPERRQNAVATAPPAGASPPSPELRANFSETAFWRPNLLTGADGSATLEFTVPDSVTSWNVWVHAITNDLSSGSLHRETQSIKDLMVRPSMPRFLREGDKAQLKVVVNNASSGDLAGEVRLAVVDPDSGRDLAADFGLQGADLVRSFKAGKGGGTNVAFTLAAPRQVRMAAFKVTATSGSLSDGELRPLPVLPSRLHLVQSRFVTLRDKDRREMTFDDLKQPDPTRVNDQMVVTVEAQLFTTVLAALPYLITYPYECTEQTLNRFLSSAIVGSVFRDFPAVARLGRALSARKTPLEAFDAADPNRKMTLEESPWLTAARGEPLDPAGSGVLRAVLDPEIAAAERAASLAKLRKAQLPTGAFPWFPGGPADPYMTLYIMSGFARAAEFKVDVPKDMVQSAWRYLATHFRDQKAHRLMADDCCWEWLTFLDYVASSYPDPSWVNAALTADERKEILEFSFKHWKQHSPYLKGLLALTLKRADRVKDARLVWASVMDSARTKPDQGTFWAPEDRSWLWYNDTIESHAFALRTVMELEPENPKKDGLALWLLLNKKLNQWKSTRATAEVIYALVHYLKADKALGVREDARVTVGGKVTDMVFEPDQLAGRKNQIVIAGPDVSPATATVAVEKTTKGFAFASATWHFSTEKLPAEARGDFFQVARTYFRRDRGGKEVTLAPLKDGATLRPGDELEVHLSLRSKHAAEYVHLRDPRGAGFEPENAVSRYRWDLGLSYYEEVRDSGANFFFAALPAGEYTFKYRVRASMAGTFRVGPATVQSLYAPEFNAYSAGHVLTVAPAP
jgi:alpha-2-macroglobulin